MSAIDASGRERIGFGQRLARWAAFVPLERGSARSAVTVDHVGPTRSETLLRRHLRSIRADGVALEIGQSGSDHGSWLPDGVTHRFMALPSEDAAADVPACLASCPTGSVDVVFSVDAIECLRAPWLVASEIARVLRPGGVTFHTSLFTTRYQPRPEDFFRYTPEGLKALFAEFECLTAEFDATERHRSPSRSSGTGDIFGGTREGWRVTYAGRKLLRR